MREFAHLLPDLDPPAGGLARLQQRIHVPRHPARPLRWAWATALAVPVLALALWMPGYITRQHRHATLTRALHQALAPPLPANGIQVTHGAAIELSSGQSNVRLYLVQTTSTVARAVPKSP